MASTFSPAPLGRRSASTHEACVFPFRETPPEPGAALLRYVANASWIAPPNQGSITIDVSEAAPLREVAAAPARQQAALSSLFERSEAETTRPECRETSPVNGPATGAFATLGMRRVEAMRQWD